MTEKADTIQGKIKPAVQRLRAAAQQLCEFRQVRHTGPQKPKKKQQTCTKHHASTRCPWLTRTLYTTEQKPHCMEQGMVSRTSLPTLNYGKIPGGTSDVRLAGKVNR